MGQSEDVRDAAEDAETPATGSRRPRWRQQEIELVSRSLLLADDGVLRLSHENLARVPPLFHAVLRATEAARVRDALDLWDLLPLSEGYRELPEVYSAVDDLARATRRLALDFEMSPDDLYGPVSESPDDPAFMLLEAVRSAENHFEIYDLYGAGDAHILRLLHRIQGGDIRRVDVDSLDQLLLRPPDDLCDQVLKDAARTLLEVTDLNLASNYIKTVPRWITKLPNLERINLSNNQISTSPDFLLSSKHPYRVILSGNPLDETYRIQVGAGTLELTGRTRFQGQILGRGAGSVVMRDLDLTQISLGGTFASIAIRSSQNVVRALSGVEGTGSLQLTDLGLAGIPKEATNCFPSRLDVSDNPIVRLQIDVRRFTQTQSITAKNCKISAVAVSNGAVASISSIDLSGNQLAKIPVRLGQLPQLSYLELAENRLETYESQIAGADGEYVAQYVRDLALATTKISSAKLVLVGEGNAGKTSLAALLKGEPFVKGRLTTHGIDRSELNLSANRKLNVWDFGGQEVYRVTHPFFFSQGALYLVVWQPREGLEQAGLKFWLDRVRYRLGPESASVILVSTHADQGRSHELDLESVEHDYWPLVRDHAAVDSETGRGKRELLRLIANLSDNLPPMGQQVPVQFASLRDWLLTRGSSAMSDDEIVANSEAARELGDGLAGYLRLLSETGDILYFPAVEGDEGVALLDPEIVSRAVSSIMESIEARSNRGHLLVADLTGLWDADGLLDRAETTGITAQRLLGILRRFDVLYVLPNDADDTQRIAPSVFMPDLLPARRPADLPWEYGDPVLAGRRSLAIEFECDAEIIGLVPWLIVRHHYLLTSHIWRRGCLLEDQGTQSSLVVELLGSARKFRYRVAAIGVYPEELFYSVTKDIEFLIRSRWSYVKYDVLVPCRSLGRSGRPCDGSYRRSDLLRASSQQVPDLQCQSCFNRHPVPTLLDRARQDQTDLGDDYRVATVIERLEDLSAQVEATAEAQAEFRGTLQTGFRLVREQIAESLTMPRMISVSLSNRRRIDLTRVTQVKLDLQLWCEAPGHQHPTGPPYTFSASREWVVQVAPYFRYLSRILKFVPLTYGAGELLAKGDGSPDLASAVQGLGDFSDAVLPGEEFEGVGSLDLLSDDLRRVQEMLRSLDPPRVFRGLRSWVLPNEQLVWLCESHYRELVGDGS